MKTWNCHRIRRFCCCLLLVCCLFKLAVGPACPVYAENHACHTPIECDGSDENNSFGEIDEEEVLILLMPLKWSLVPHAITPLQLPFHALAVYSSLLSPPE